MITIIALVLQVLMTLITPQHDDVVIIPAAETEEIIAWEWAQFNADAYLEYADEFTALFNSYEVKRAKNGAMMIKRAGDKSFKFCKKG